MVFYNGTNFSPKVIVLFLVAVIILVLNGIPYYIQYSTSEVVAPLKYLEQSQSTDQSNLYVEDVNAYKSRILFVWFYSQLEKIIDIPYNVIDHVNFVLTSILVFAAMIGMHRSVGLPLPVAMGCALCFMLFNPFRAIYYGYHYKVGGAGATIGIIAFSLITAMFHFLQRKNLFVHLILLALLYFVHPLNALLYAGFLGFYYVSKSILNKKWSPDFKFILFNLILVSILFVLTMDRYLSSANTDKNKLFVLISLINGYFFSWFDPNRLVQAVVFFPSFMALALGGYRKNYFSRDAYLFFIIFSIYSLLLCLLNVIAYYARIDFLLPLAISRVFALQMPLVYILCIGVLYHIWKQNRKSLILAMGILLLVSIRFHIVFFPLFVAVTLFADERNLRKFLVPFAPFLALVLCINLDFVTGIEFSKSFLLKSKVSFLMLLFISFTALFYPYLKKSMLFRYATLLLSVLILFNRYQIEFKTTVTESRLADKMFSELESFIDKNSEPSDIVLSEDMTLNRINIRPTFIDFGSLAYGIYMGNLSKLENEARLIWDINLTSEYLDEFRKNKAENELRLDYQMKNILKKYTVERLQIIKEKYPRFRYILVGKDDLPFDNKLPIHEVYTDDKFSLFKVDL